MSTFRHGVTRPPTSPGCAASNPFATACTTSAWRSGASARASLGPDFGSEQLPPHASDAGRSARFLDSVRRLSSVLPPSARGLCPLLLDEGVDLIVGPGQSLTHQEWERLTTVARSLLFDDGADSQKELAPAISAWLHDRSGNGAPAKAAKVPREPGEPGEPGEPRAEEQRGKGRRARTN